jgi:hypothetical protein
MSTFYGNDLNSLSQNKLGFFEHDRKRKRDFQEHMARMEREKSVRYDAETGRTRVRNDYDIQGRNLGERGRQFDLDDTFRNTRHRDGLSQWEREHELNLDKFKEVGRQFDVQDGNVKSRLELDRERTANRDSFFGGSDDAQVFWREKLYQDKDAFETSKTAAERANILSEQLRASKYRPAREKSWWNFNDDAGYDEAQKLAGRTGMPEGSAVEQMIDEEVRKILEGSGIPTAGIERGRDGKYAARPSALLADYLRRQQRTERPVQDDDENGNIISSKLPFDPSSVDPSEEFQRNLPNRPGPPRGDEVMPKRRFRNGQMVVD